MVTSINVAENICARVPHRQFVFTMPKRFRLYFRFNRELLRGVPRNFEVFDPLDFLAEITQYIPDPGMQMVRYYGWYSNKMRGQRTKHAKSAKPDVAAMDIDDEDTDYRKLCRMRWAALIKRVWEVDPLLCPKCQRFLASRLASFLLFSAISKGFTLPRPGRGGRPSPPERGRVAKTRNSAFLLDASTGQD